MNNNYFLKILYNTLKFLDNIYIFSIIIFTKCRKILLDNINIFYYIIGVNLKKR